MSSQPQQTNTLIQDLAKHQTLPEDGILTRTVLDDDRCKVVLFSFSQGQTLSEHTASMPAVLHFVTGSATLTLGQETLDAEPGTWVHMPAQMPHTICTKTPVVMLLTLFKNPTATPNPADPAG